MHDSWGDLIRNYMDRRVTPPKRVTLPTRWGPQTPCKEAVNCFVKKGSFNPNFRHEACVIGSI